MNKKKCYAVVLAAGSGRRMKSDIAKQYLDLDGKPLLWYALHVFEKSKIIDEIILVVGNGEIPYCKEEIVEKYSFQKVVQIVEGGAERYLSVWEALKVIRDKKNKDYSQAEYVYIHDGARPFVTEEILQNAYDAVEEHGACVVGMPVKDTIKLSDEEGFAIKTLKRKQVWQIQTPQVFEVDLVVNAYKSLIGKLDELKAEGVEITDDAMVVELMMAKMVKLVKGSYENIKITTPEDMKIAHSLNCSKC